MFPGTEFSDMNMDRHGAKIRLTSGRNSPFIHALLCMYVFPLPSPSCWILTTIWINFRLQMIYLESSSARMKHATSRHGREPDVVALPNYGVDEALASINWWVKPIGCPSVTLTNLVVPRPSRIATLNCDALHHR